MSPAPVTTDYLAHIKPLKAAAAAQTTETKDLQAIAAGHLTKGTGRLREHVFVEGKGINVWTSDGRRLLDFSSGIGVTSLGHAHPDVTAAIAAQAAKIVHVQCAIANSQPQLQLIKQLLPMMPDASLDTFFFWNSGGEANEAAIKVARCFSKRQNLIVMQGSYHGRSMGAASLTRSKTIYFEGTGPLLTSVFATPFPYWHAMGFPKDTPSDVLVSHAVKHLENLLQQQTAPKDTAAIFIEPVLGEGGYIQAPPAYMQALRRICDQHGILLIADEVQAGFYRTGTPFAIQHTGVRPDIMVFAKGVANGMPLSGIVTRKEIMDVMPPMSLGGTYAGNAVACAAGVATTKYMATHDIAGNVNARAEQARKGLMAIADGPGGSIIEEVRVTGLMMAIEFKDPRDAGSEAFPAGLNKMVQDACLDKGLLTLTMSIYSTLRMIPALIVSEEEIDQMLAIFGQCVRDVAAKVGAK
ncbi:4-aminobutyrate aminotransferase GabT [Vanrija pseudolonga]|uniref:4-aminobutyrate aminotransferase GabT n=1 Tax=Vanrija pseudolonga TaxID=143232 RepID=A0AAF1BM92_9TREE|nr:4-aminobutyrate aminotransferase GabT [Vanrija pseudolonga]